MGWLKATGKIIAGTASLVGKATVVTAKATGHTIHGAAKFVGDHQQEIASATKAVVNVTGKVVEGTGAVLSSGARAASRSLHSAADESSGRTGKVLGKLGGYTADAVGLVGGGHKAGGLGDARHCARPGGRHRWSCDRLAWRRLGGRGLRHHHRQ